MKNQKIFSLFALCVAFGTIIFCSFKTSGPKTKPETQICYGPAITTDNMDEARIAGPYNPKVYGEYANSWFKNYTLTVTAPSGWHFTGKPFVNCVRDDRGAFGWNNFPAAHDRFYVTQSNPNLITATCWAGSRSIVINLACEATKN